MTKKDHDAIARLQELSRASEGCSKAFKMLQKMGFTGTVGASQARVVEPLSPKAKPGRMGVGLQQQQQHPHHDDQAGSKNSNYYSNDNSSSGSRKNKKASVVMISASELEKQEQEQQENRNNHHHQPQPSSYFFQHEQNDVSDEPLILQIGEGKRHGGKKTTDRVFLVDPKEWKQSDDSGHHHHHHHQHHSHHPHSHRFEEGGRNRVVSSKSDNSNAALLLARELKLGSGSSRGALSVDREDFRKGMQLEAEEEARSKERRGIIAEIIDRARGWEKMEKQDSHDSDNEERLFLLCQYIEEVCEMCSISPQDGDDSIVDDAISQLTALMTIPLQRLMERNLSAFRNTETGSNSSDNNNNDNNTDEEGGGKEGNDPIVLKRKAAYVGKFVPSILNRWLRSVLNRGRTEQETDQQAELGIVEGPEDLRPFAITRVYTSLVETCVVSKLLNYFDKSCFDLLVEKTEGEEEEEEEEEQQHLEKNGEKMVDTEEKEATVENVETREENNKKGNNQDETSPPEKGPTPQQWIESMLFVISRLSPCLSLSSSRKLERHASTLASQLLSRCWKADFDHPDGLCGLRWLATGASLLRSSSFSSTGGGGGHMMNVIGRSISSWLCNGGNSDNNNNNNNNQAKLLWNIRRDVDIPEVLLDLFRLGLLTETQIDQITSLVVAPRLIEALGSLIVPDPSDGSSKVESTQQQMKAVEETLFAFECWLPLLPKDAVAVANIGGGNNSGGLLSPSSTTAEQILVESGLLRRWMRVIQRALATRSADILEIHSWYVQWSTLFKPFVKYFHQVCSSNEENFVVSCVEMVMKRGLDLINIAIDDEKEEEERKAREEEERARKSDETTTLKRKSNDSSGNSSNSSNSDSEREEKEKNKKQRTYQQKKNERELEEEEQQQQEEQTVIEHLLQQQQKQQQQSPSSSLSSSSHGAVLEGGFIDSRFSSSTSFSLTETIELLAAKEGVDFLPWMKKTRPPQSEGRKLFELGRLCIFVEGEVLFAWDKKRIEWRAISLKKALSCCK